MTTQIDLTELKAAYASGVLKVREGNSWVEYQSMKEMRIAIKELEAELSGSKPLGVRRVITGKGY